MSDVQQRTVAELVAAREQVDSLVNSFAPSSDEEAAAYTELRDKSEALTAMINAGLARPFSSLAGGFSERVAELERATSRLKQVESNVAGVKEAISITDEILKIAIDIATPEAADY